MPYGNITYPKSFNNNHRFSFEGENYFESVWKTDNISTGSSNDNQVKLPLESTGTYNFTVDWGDGQKNTITAYNQVEVTHTYSSIGTYTIKIKGICIGWRFNNIGDKLKILEIKKWGNLKLGDNDLYFYGCTNINISALDSLNSVGMTSFDSMFLFCSNLNGKLNTDTSNIISFRQMYYACTKFNQPVSNFNTSNATNMYAMFSSSRLFNQSVSSFDTSKVTNMYAMFNGCLFNQPVSNFNTSNVTNFEYMFNGCDMFNQDISNFIVINANYMSNMLQGAISWSTSNYDLALISWANQNVKDGVTFGCSTRYTLGGAAEAARNHLQNIHGWTINDLGGI